MQEGDTRLTQAAFIAEFGYTQKGRGFSKQYQFKWCSNQTNVPYPGWCQPGLGSQLVSVYRVPQTSSPTWTVTTSSADLLVGPVAELHLVGGSPSSDTFLGLYAANFKLTIVCQTNCDALPQ